MSYSGIVKLLENEDFCDVFLDKVNSVILKKEALENIRRQLEKAENDLSFSESEMAHLFKAVYNDKDLSHHIRSHYDCTSIRVVSENCLFAADLKNDSIKCYLETVYNKDYEKEKDKLP